MSKIKVLGTTYGITITRPWSDEMYAFNEKVAAEMKDQIQLAINKAYENRDAETLHKIGKALNGYGYGKGYGYEDMADDTQQGLDRAQNHWLHSDAYPDLLELGLVENLNQYMIGYDKPELTDNTI